MPPNLGGRTLMPVRRQCLRWAGWFAAANAGHFRRWSACASWLTYPFDAGSARPCLRRALAYVGHFSLLAALPIGLIVVPLAVLVPPRAPGSPRPP